MIIERIKRADYDIKTAFTNIQRCASSCNCSFCRSSRKDAGTILREKMDNWYQSSALENKRIHEEAEKTKRLLQLTSKDKRRGGWDDVDRGTSYRNF